MKVKRILKLDCNCHPIRVPLQLLTLGEMAIAASN